MDTHAERDLLTRLIADLDAATSWGDPPLLAAAAGSPADPVLVLVDLDGAPPSPTFAGRLVGLTAPPNWLAVAVVAEGWASNASFEAGMRGAPPPSLQPDRRRIRTLHAIGREGGESGRLRWRDDGAVDDRDEPAMGAVHDCLLRILGRSTPPPEDRVGELFALLWLDNCLARAAADARRLTWQQAARLHPVAQLLHGTARDLRRPAPADLVEAAGLLELASTWADVQANVVDRGWLPAVVTADEAAWMDAGMFARWVLGGFPPLRALLAHTELLALGPGAAPDVRDVLERLGLLDDEADGDCGRTGVSR